VDGRRRAAAAYAEAGLGDHVGLPSEPAGTRAAWHLYVVGHPRPDELRSFLADRGIDSRGYYRTPLHRQRAMAPYITPGLSLPATDELARTNLALPISPALTEAQAREVAAAVASAGLS
jgi:dTDP-4-amino-4,6-dideoxygalactose transaminase